MTINKDILVIGAGPAGVSAAVYLSRSKYSFCIVEKEMLGGKLNTITQIDNYPGFASISGVELIKRYQDQLKARNVDVIHDGINGITRVGNFYNVIGDNNTYVVKVIIICSGSSNKKSNVPGEKEFLGKGISYCAVCDGFFYRNKDVLVFANGAKGYKEAMYLSNLVKTLYLVNDNNKDDEENNLAKLKKLPNVTFLYPFKINEFFGDDLGLTGVKIEDLNNHEVKDISCVGAFPFIGDVPGSYFLTSLDIIADNGYITVDQNQKTNLDGIFAAGDIAKKSLKQIVTASSDGAVAATSAIRYLNSLVL